MSKRGIPAAFGELINSQELVTSRGYRALEFLFRIKPGRLKLIYVKDDITLAVVGGFMNPYVHVDFPEDDSVYEHLAVARELVEHKYNEYWSNPTGA